MRAIQRHYLNAEFGHFIPSSWPENYLNPSQQFAGQLQQEKRFLRSLLMCLFFSFVADHLLIPQLEFEFHQILCNQGSFEDCSSIL
jgi:hypothetical protein